MAVLTSANFPMTVGGEPDGAPYLWDYYYAIFNLPRMPSWWNTDGYPKRQRVSLDWYADVIGSSTLRYIARMYNSSGMDYYEGGTTTETTAAWGNGTFPIDSTAYPKGTPVNDLAWIGDKPHGLAIEMAFQHTNAATDSEVYGVYFESIQDKNYTGAFSEANTRYAEVMSRDTYGKKGYQDKRPLSSWQMMELANTLNNFLYEDRMVWTLPLYGSP